ncbi:protein-tyrosine phosphatase-like protein [Biscogniauxia marginata]|nr:protein-tyrosine phosphatase-like protein [Biscogniauxia marginata]
MAVVFDNILNFRDVGKTVNDYIGRKVLREGVLYRSARPDDATPEDRRRLASELGVRTVIDLRTKTEHLKQAEKQKRQQAAAAAAGLTEPAERENVRIPGLQYREIKVTGPRFERFLLSQLSWWNFFKVIILYIFGYRTQAIGVISREVMLPRGLVGLGTVTLDTSGPEIAEALNTLLQPSSLPLLIHCTQGKDRTGLIIALTLMAIGDPSTPSPTVPLDAIEHDYLLTREGLAGSESESEKDERLTEIREIGLTSEWGDCPSDFVRRVRAHLDGAYGGVGAYLDGIGFGAEERSRLVEVLGA